MSPGKMSPGSFFYAEHCWRRRPFWRPFHLTYLLQAYFAAGRGLRPLLTQLATPILTPKIGLGDESGPDIR
jgi:hypothetical protein